jgi:hypothetical protein
MGLKEQEQQLVSEAVSKAAAQLVEALQQGQKRSPADLSHATLMCCSSS